MSSDRFRGFLLFHFTRSSGLQIALTRGATMQPSRRSHDAWKNAKVEVMPSQNDTSCSCTSDQTLRCEYCSGEERVFASDSLQRAAGIRRLGRRRVLLIFLVFFEPDLRGKIQTSRARKYLVIIRVSNTKSLAGSVRFATWFGGRGEGHRGGRANRVNVNEHTARCPPQILIRFTRVARNKHM